MTQPTSENNLAQSLNPEKLLEPAPIPESAALALGGIGLDNFGPKTLPLNGEGAKHNSPSADLIGVSRQSDITTESLVKKLSQEPDAELDKDELRVLYGIDIPCFDPNSNEDMEEINSSLLVKFRTVARAPIQKHDLSKALDISPDQIAITQAEWENNKENIIYLYGDFHLPDEEINNNFKLPKYIQSDLVLANLESLNDLTLPEYVGGELNLAEIQSAGSPLILPKFVGGYLELFSLSSAKNITFPEYVGSTIGLPNIESVEGLEPILQSHEGVIILPLALESQLANLKTHPALVIKWN